MYYVYRFINKEGLIIYIGRTENISGRLVNQHFTVRGHLSQECYRETVKVEYAVLSSQSEMKVYELYLINKYVPKYNVLENNQDKFKFVLPEIEWVEFTGKNEPTHVEELGKEKKRVERLRKNLRELREERREIRKEAESLLMTVIHHLQVMDYVLTRSDVSYDREELVRVGLDIEYFIEKVKGESRKTRQEYYRERGLGEKDLQKILWEGDKEEVR